MARTLRELVRARAGGRCEYCKFPDRFSIRPFHCDHIIAEQHSGKSSIENRSWACNHCNLHKGPNLSGVDPVTDKIVLLFHPRKDRWKDHFTWQGAILRGLTPRGRATIQVLDSNDPFLIATRAALIEEGSFFA